MSTPQNETRRRSERRVLRQALADLWACRDRRCSLCAVCLQALRDALGVRLFDPTIPAPITPADDPIRIFRSPRPPKKESVTP